jgi:hypothetical protein
MSEKFNAQSKLTKMQGKDYLEVKWRIAWFRDEHPKGSILTDVINDGLIKATIIDSDGKVLATGHGTPKMQGVAKSRPFEGAETAAIGRALAHAGYGTQFADELEESEHLADAPVEKKNDEIVTDATWTAWMELVIRADAVKVPHKIFDRAKVKASLLKETAKELREIVINAEQQAKAGE